MRNQNVLSWLERAVTASALLLAESTRSSTAFSLEGCFSPNRKTGALELVARKFTGRLFYRSFSEKKKIPREEGLPRGEFSVPSFALLSSFLGCLSSTFETAEDLTSLTTTGFVKSDAASLSISWIEGSGSSDSGISGFFSAVMRSCTADVIANWKTVD